jgi:hypothetical protein
MKPSRTPSPFPSKAATLAVVGLAAVVASAAACSLGERPGVRTAQRDSAGVVIIENEGSLPSDGGGWSVALEPLLSIGAVEGGETYQLFGVAGVHRFDDGRIGVVSAGSREVRIYGAEGAFLASFGRQGGGPEEFEAPALAGAIGGTLLVVDRAQHRIAYVHPDRGFVGLVRVADDVGGFLNPAGTFANGESVFGGAFDMRRIGELRNGMNRARTYYRSCRPDGSLAADFGGMEGAEFFIRDLEAEGAASRPALTPFARVPVATLSADRFFFSNQNAYQIQVHEPSGRMVRLIRLARDPVAVTPADGRAHIDDIVGQMGSPDQAAAARAQLESLPLPEVFPAHGVLLADALGFLWVEDFQRPGKESRAWNVFSPGGALVGRVTMPDRFSPLEIGHDHVLGVGWDELNVESVRMYGLTRPRG